MSDASIPDTNTAELAGPLHPALSDEGVAAAQSEDRGTDLRVVRAAPRGHCPTKRLVAVAAVFVQLAAGSPAWPQPTNHLDAIDHQLVIKLGAGVVGAPVEPIDPAKLIAAITRPHSTEFRVTEGPKKGETVLLSVRKRGGGSNATASGRSSSWTHELPGILTEHVVENSAGLSASTLVIGTSGYSSTYRPPEPLLLSAIADGKSKSFLMDVEVHTKTQPDKVKYHGQIRVTYSNKGTYRIKTPAGDFDGLVVRTTYKGKLGPATMNDADIRIYSPTMGLIALVVHTRLHAALVLNRDQHTALLIDKPSKDAP